ncbi:MAG: molybdate ABC transporter substrate-binding protein [Acidimicrobiales bacterium]
MRKSTMRYFFILLSLVGLVAAGCGDDSSSNAARTTASPKATGDITVLAAASLTESFKEIGTAFEAANPGAKVTFSFAASSALATQINQGAPTDVFASADTTNMDKITASSGAGTAAAPVTFATNKLQIIVGKGNPKGITGLADLAKSGLIYVTAAPEVPIGAYAKQVLDKAKVTVTPKSLEADVKSVVNKVTLGEADAGIVYTTDVKAAGDKAVGVTIPDDVNVIATYPIAVTKPSKNASAATAFVAFVTGAQGQTILAKYGFTKP